MSTYEKIKTHCRINGTLFEDQDFPAIDKSLFFSKQPPVPFVWKRPNEICSNPKLFIGGANRADISQGKLGNCWLLAAMSSLAMYESLFYQVVPADQSFDEDYLGIFRFRFWQFGKWEEVVIDDRLPTYNNKLVFVHSKTDNEFWSALLEKAYAKLCSSYEALNRGQTSEALEDFTGGICEAVDLRKTEISLLEKILNSALERQSLIGCSIEAKPNEIEAKLDNGLVKGHAYSVTGFKHVRVNIARRIVETYLIRIRNPWGNEREWTGTWSDSSEEWKQVSVEEKRELNLTLDDDGEFWMSLDDFKNNFTKLEVVLLSPGSLVSSVRQHWQMSPHLGSWQRGVSAGGCRNFIDSFHLNPQYRITVESTELDMSPVVIGLMQKDRRTLKKYGRQNLTIGFAIYKMMGDTDETLPLGQAYFQYHQSHARSDNFINGREVTGRFDLSPGDYVIIPSTFKSNEEGDYILRIFTEKEAPSCTSDSTTVVSGPYKPRSEDEDAAFDATFESFFEKVAGNSGAIEGSELSKVLSAAFKKELNMAGVSEDTCRSLIAGVDRDRNGALSYSEFRDLWRSAMEWKNTFGEHDQDGTLTLNAVEFRNALAKLGFKLSTPMLQSLLLRYGGDNSREISFEGFLKVIVKVQAGFESYLSFQGKSFSLDDYLMSVTYN